MQRVRLPGVLGDLEQIGDVRCQVRGAREEPRVVRRRKNGVCGVLLEGTFERTVIEFILT